MTSTDQALEMYMDQKKRAFGHGFRKPKPGSETYQCIEHVCILLDEMGGNFMDFLELILKVYSMAGVFPQAKQLACNQSIHRYMRHLAQKMVQDKDLYTLDGHDLVVKATGERYTLEQVKLGSHSDSDAQYAFSMCNLGHLPTGLQEKDKRELKKKVYYLLAKLAYHGRAATDSLVRLKGWLDKEREI